VPLHIAAVGNRQRQCVFLYKCVNEEITGQAIIFVKYRYINKENYLLK